MTVNQHIYDETLLVLQTFIFVNRYSPSVRELALECGVTASTMHTRLQELKSMGKVSWQPGLARSLVLLEDSK